MQVTLDAGSVRRLLRPLDPLRRPMARLHGADELLEDPLEDTGLVAGALDDLARINRLAGGIALSRSALVSVATHGYGLLRRPARPVRLLDVGTGGADIPAALIAWARAHGLELSVEAVDASGSIIELARTAHREEPDLHLEVADGRSLPYPDDAFDIGHASLMAHHLDPDELARFLAELGRVSAVAVIINDLDRARRWLAIAYLITRLFTRNRITRYDGPLSVRRAYSPTELSAIASRAGLREVAHLRGFIGHRYALVLASPRKMDAQLAGPASTGPTRAKQEPWRER